MDNDDNNAMSVKDVKENVLLLKKEADEKSDQISAMTAELDKLITQKNEVKVEVESLHKRSALLEEESAVCGDTLESMQTQMDNLGKLADENERWRKEYEKKQMDSDERVDEMTSIVKAAYQSTEIAAAKYDEAFEKLHQTTSNISDLEKKIDAVKKRIDQREKEVKEKITTYKQLQFKSEERIEKEIKKKEYINFLKKQVEEAELRAQKAEAEVLQKQEDVNRLKNRIKFENDSVGTLKKDMTSMCSEFKKL